MNISNLYKKPVVLVPLAVFVPLFFIGGFFGKFGPVLMSSQVCYKYLGCNAGFGGYDAILHFLSGMMNVNIILALCLIVPAFNPFHRGKFFKNFMILISMIGFIALLWEIGEYSTDWFRMSILHINLLYPVNHLFQPTNADTMGDMTFSLVGATIYVGIIASFGVSVFDWIFDIS